LMQPGKIPNKAKEHLFAWPILLPGGAVNPAMNAATGFVTWFWMNSAAPAVGRLARGTPATEGRKEARREIGTRMGPDRPPSDQRGSPINKHGLTRHKIGCL